MRREPAGNHRRFYASCIQATRCPIAGYSQVIVGVVQRRNAILLATGQRKNVAVARIHIRSPMLGFKTRVIPGGSLTIGRFLLGIHQKVPFEFAAPSYRLWPKLGNVTIEVANCTVLNFLPPPLGVAASGDVSGRYRIVQHAAKVSYSFRIHLPTLLSN